jgi:hypothetical protein
VKVRIGIMESGKVIQMRSDLTPEKIQQFMSALSNHGFENSNGKNCLDLVSFSITFTMKVLYFKAKIKNLYFKYN